MRRLTSAAGVTIVLAAVLLVWPVSAQTPGKWIKLAAFPEPREELLGAAAGGKLYVFAGLAPGWKPRGVVYEYDPATDRWTKRTLMVLPSHHVAFATLNGKIYAFGGFKPALRQEALLNVAGTLRFAPEDFHIRLFQDYGVVSGIQGSTILLNLVRPEEVRRIAQYYWVRRITPPVLMGRVGREL